MEEQSQSTKPVCIHGHTEPHRFSVPVFDVGEDSEAYCPGPRGDGPRNDFEADAPFIPKRTADERR